MKIGIIGAAGEHAEQSHVPQLYAEPECWITALADLNKTGAQAIRDRYAPGADVTTEWQEVVENPEVDAVFVLTSDEFHTEQMLGAIQNGKHVFVEKPMANNWRDYGRLKDGLRLAEEQGLVVSTCHPRRFDPPFVNTKRFLDDPALLATEFGLNPGTEFGPAIKFSLRLNYSRPGRSDKHLDFMSDHLGHELDTASHFFGFSGLKTAVSTINEKLKFAVKAEREDGLKLDFRGNRLQPEKRCYREDWSIMFANGMVLSVDADKGEANLASDGGLINTIIMGDYARPLFKTDYTVRFRDLNAHVLRSFSNPERQPYLSAREMLFNTIGALALSTTHRSMAIPATMLTT